MPVFATPNIPPVVVLLGAGASRDAGLHLATQLTDDLRDSIERNNDTDLKSALGLILGGIAMKRGVDGARIDQPVDIETVMRVAFRLANRNNHPFAGYVAAWHTALEQISPGGDPALFNRLMSRAREILEDVLRTPDDSASFKYLANIANLTRPLHTDRPPIVFTLNYDLCTEKALEYEERPYTTGFCDGVWDEREFDDPNRVRLYKLHGSFGWVRHPQTRMLYDRDRAFDRDDIDIVSGETPDELVFGTDNKLQAYHPFLWMAYRFSEAVASTRYLVTIGYGFGDEYVNQIISQGMASDPVKRLVVVAPDLDGGRIENALGFTFYPERTDFLQDTARKALHDEDTIIKRIVAIEEATEHADPFAGT